MGRLTRRGRLRAPFWNGRRGAIAKAVLALAPVLKLLGAGWRDERGSVAFMTAALGVVLIGFAALAVDVNVWEGNVGTMQGAADQAALAASVAMSAGRSAAQNEAKGVAAAHGFVDGMGGVSVTLTVNPATNAIEVVITQPQTTFLSGLFLGLPPTASVRAVATPAPASTCILALTPTGTGIDSSGLGDIDVPSCSIYVNSTSNCGLNVSSSHVISQDLFLGGTQSQAICKSILASVSAPTHFNAPAAPDPYASMTMPPPSTPCTPLNTSNTTFSPGTYCGGATLGGIRPITLNPGVYIFDGGDLNISGAGSVTATNVTLVFTSSSKASYGTLNVTGLGAINLTAPTSGATDGIAIWVDGAGRRKLNLSGLGSLSITGAIYAPGSKVTFGGLGDSQCTQLVALTVSLPALASLQHNCTGVHVKDVPGVTGYKLTE